MQSLHRLFKVDIRDWNLPVAFASNALYVLARNGLVQTDESQKLIREQLIPLLLSKQSYLHGEGISMAIYALNEAGIYEEEVWSMLAAKCEEHNFDYQVIKGNRWVPGEFRTMSGKEHYF